MSSLAALCSMCFISIHNHADMNWYHMHSISIHYLICNRSMQLSAPTTVVGLTVNCWSLHNEVRRAAEKNSHGLIRERVLIIPWLHLQLLTLPCKFSDWTYLIICCFRIRTRKYDTFLNNRSYLNVVKGTVWWLCLFFWLYRFNDK